MTEELVNLVIKVDKKLHHDFKVKCATDGITMRDWINKQIERYAGAKHA